ncbi:MAG: SLOG family protein [Evtepia gabavorous]
MTFDSPSYTLEKKGPTGHGKEAFPWTLLSPAASPATARPASLGRNEADPVPGPESPAGPGPGGGPPPGLPPLPVRHGPGADLYFCQAVLDLRQRHPEVTLEAAIPFAGQADHWSAADQRRRMTLLDQCDLETVVQHTYTPGCMNRRNRYMVDRSSLLIAVYDGIPQGGTLNTLSYAMGKGVRTVILPVVSPAQ